MLAIYVAGPFRGRDSWEMEQNIRRAEALSLEVWRLGCAAICPHANTRYFQGALPDETWLLGDLELMRRCDGVLVTEDWERSLGAVAEVDEALRNGIRVFFDLEQLKEYVAAQLT